MKTIQDSYQAELIIKKSKFIGYIIRVDNIQEIKNKLNEISKHYQDSTHICYAYICDNEKRMVDDGEPSKTAGKPIMDLLEKRQFNHVIGVVIRYFGGIKLGSNGLIRAYAKAIKEAIDKASIINLEKGYIITIQMTYQDEKYINALLTNCEIIIKDYQESIYYQVKVSQEKSHELLLNNIKFTIIKEIYL